MDEKRHLGFPAVLAVFALLMGYAFVALYVASLADAATSPKLLVQFPENANIGSGADQLTTPRAVATNPVTGDVYVAESGNNRISEFTAWGEFVKAWGWGVKDGTSEAQVCGPEKPEASPPVGLCQAGIAGVGAGQMDVPNGIATDSTGDVYVFEEFNGRVQKFNAAGQFLLMFGGGVDQGPNHPGNVCTAAFIAEGDTCGAGSIGTANGQFTPPTSSLGAVQFAGNYMAVGSDGTIYVGDKNRIQKFNPDGTYQGQIPLPENGSPGTLAFDAKSGDLYFSFFQFGETPFDPPIYKLDPATGSVLGTLKVEAPAAALIEGLATDAEGDVYAVVGVPGTALQSRVLEFGAAGEPLIGFAAEFAVSPAALLLGLATNGIGDLYVAERNNVAPTTSSISALGPPPIAFGPPPKVPPVVVEQFAVSVDATGANVRARINPRFFADTKYYVEYGSQSCESSLCQKQPSAPGSGLTTEVVNAPVAAGVFLSGLNPNTTYHYRFVAQSGGGGPVKGAERTFTTAPLPVQQPPCTANQAFRAGPAALLPDCRAYEMVSPVDKNGADISVVLDTYGSRTGLDQSARSGDDLTYSAYRAFGEVESAPYTSQYLAQRTEGVGWSSKGISPPREGPAINKPAGTDSAYKGFSGDLCHGWVLQDAEPSLAPGSVAGYPNLYRRDICEGGYEALAPAGTLSIPGSSFRPELQGFSADGSRAIFVAEGKLTSNASNASQLYEVSGGQLHLVCILPNKTAVSTECSAGTAAGSEGSDNDRGAFLSHAISEDGTRIYWTRAEKGAGELYVRVNGTQTTLVSAEPARFWTAAADGSKAIYSVGGELFEFDLASKASKLIAKGFEGVMGASDDASSVYFVSSEVLPGAGKNSEEDEAAAGKPNIYLYEAGEPASFSFVDTLASSDVGAGLSPVSTVPVGHTSQVTPDGGAVAFMSKGQLTGYDNTDVSSGEADSEVFLYHAASKALVCVSCDPSGARPAGRDVASESGFKQPFWAAGQIPAAQNQVHFPRVFSEDGTRLFFESFDPLSLRDTNAKRDVYEWEAQGAGNCAEGAPGFRASLAGCVNLISSGESPQDSELVEASPDGRDVFFKTTASLLPQDPGLLDIYDARAGGGFPIQEPPPPPCQGEACQSPAPAPNDPTPSSANFHGPGNVKPQSCPKGKHKAKRNGKASCVKNHKNKQKAKKNGRAGR